MQRTSKLFTILIAISVISGLCLVYARLNPAGHALPETVPELYDVSDRSAESDRVSRVPTVLALDHSGDETSQVISAFESDSVRFLSDGAQPSGVIPSGVIPASGSVVPDGILPRHENLIPLPNPFEHAVPTSDHTDRDGKTALEQRGAVR